MSASCVMCGKSIAQGILCEKCDRPRKSEPKQSSSTAQPVSKQSSAPAPALQQPAPDPFPKAPVVPFPVESTSLAITTLCDVLTAARVAGLVITGDRNVKFCSADARDLLGFAEGSKSPSIPELEIQMGMKIPDLREPFSSDLHLPGGKASVSLVPMAGGVGGAVLIFRPHEAAPKNSEFMSYVREAVVGPLGGLRQSLAAAAKSKGAPPLISDAASTIDQILSSLELAPEVEEGGTAGAAPGVVDVIRRVGDRFTPVAERKNVKLQLDVQQDISEPFRDHHELEAVLVTLMENSLHYVPRGGQIVLGLRKMDHKGKPLLLFFTMDTGPLVPDELKDAIFTPEFAWHPSSPQRGGRGLARCRDFAVAHGGSIWVESKTGKACTFFLRVRPDSAM